MDYSETTGIDTKISSKCCQLCQLLDPDAFDSIYGRYQNDTVLQEYTRLKFLTPPSRLPYDLPENPDPSYKEREKLLKTFFKTKVWGTRCEFGRKFAWQSI